MSSGVPWRLLFLFALALALGILLCLAFLKLTLISIPFLLGLALSILAEPVLLYWESRGGTRALGIFLFFVCLVFFIGILLVVLPPRIEQQILLLREHAPRFLEELRSYLSFVFKGVADRVPGLSQEHLFAKIQEHLRPLGERLLFAVPSLISHLLFTVLLTPVFTFFILRDRRSLRKKLLNLIPNRHFEMVFGVVHRVEEATEAYIRGILLEAVIVGALATAILLVLGVRAPLVLGLCMIVANLIPYVGTITMSVAGTLYLLLLGAPFSEAILVVVAVGISHLIDNILVAPLVLGRAVEVHPLVVLVLLILGGKLLGVLGLVISVPLGAIVYILVQESWAFLCRYRGRGGGVEEIRKSV